MANDTISFKSFYYSLGTTSFRMQNFNQKIEQQLSLLDSFWQDPSNAAQPWEENEKIQEKYYDYLKSNGFLKEGIAPRKAKDARQKTSGLRDIGLINNNRRLTAVGKRLLDIAKSGDFTSDNILQIPKDSFLYFQQLLKTPIAIDKAFAVRPFILLARLLKKFNYLSKEEFMYLFPLCINAETTEFIESQLSRFREKSVNINEIISKIFLGQQNYKSALKLFLHEDTLTEELFCTIGLNRKSKDYDKEYFPLYNAIKKVYYDDDKSRSAILNLFKASDIRNVKTHWRKFLFNTSSSQAIKKSPLEHLQTANMFTNIGTEEKFKKIFFVTMHLIKIKRTLEDYYDLNRRYLKISDTLLFEDSQVKFDIIPKYYFSLVSDDFYNLAFTQPSGLEELLTLEQISPSLKIDDSKLLAVINKENGLSLAKIEDIRIFVKDERIKRFNKLIDKQFTDDQLIYILQLINQRQDDEIQSLVTDDADIPTIFEYILGIAWYKISGRKGDILSFMNLSLEADLLPKTHASGGEADLVFQYEESDGNYPKHSVLIEATLSDSTNQRRMEMEPVSRHLGEYLLSHPSQEAYCVFISNFLHMNVISDFRGRRNTEYYGGKNCEKVIEGMMITPLENELLITILQKGIKYSQLYKIFHELQESSLAPREWFEELKKQLNSLEC